MSLFSSLDVGPLETCDFSSEDHCGFLDRTTDTQYRWHRIVEKTTRKTRQVRMFSQTVCTS